MGKPTDVTIMDLDEAEILALVSWHTNQQYEASGQENYTDAEYHRVKKEKYRNSLKPVKS